MVDEEVDFTETLRYWAESSSGVHGVVMRGDDFDPRTIQNASLMTSPDVSSVLKDTNSAPGIFKTHDSKIPFGECFSSAVELGIEQQSSLLNKHLHQSIECVILDNIAQVGWEWVEIVDYEDYTVHLQGGNPFDPILSIAFSIGCTGTVQLRVTTNSFWTEENDWVGKYHNNALVRVKDDYLACIAKYEPFLHQLKDLRTSAYVIQESLVPVTEVFRRQEGHFRPKEVLLKLLLVCRPGTTVAGEFAIRSGSEANPLICEFKEIEVRGADRCLFANLWEKNKHRWSGAATLRQNIEAIMEVDLMATRTNWNSEQQDPNTQTPPECAICYCSHLTNEKGGDEPSSKWSHVAPLPVPPSHAATAPRIPDAYATCMNEHCDKLFHRECAKSWLLSLSDVRKSFGVLFGTCPYCSNSLEVRE